jgi:hypothetical protein
MSDNEQTEPTDIATTVPVYSPPVCPEKICPEKICPEKVCPIYICPDKVCPKTQNIYSIFHLLLVFLAIYMSFRCNNNKFNLGSFLAACSCPQIYLVYILATQGTCGIFEKCENIVKT